MLKQLAVATLMSCAIGSAHAWDAGPIVTGAPAYYAEQAHAPGEFWDTVTFSITGGKLGMSVNGLTVTDPFSGGNARHISDLTYSLLFDGSEIASYNGGLAPSYAILNAGDYELRINGIADGGSGGTYGMALAVTPVPEPATIGMLMMGLGLLGLARRSDDAANDKFS